MAQKTFISYKYSEAQDLRDSIIKALGDDAIYYQGETSTSPDLTDTSTDNIKNNLKNMMHGTSVTIVIISPEMKQSKWIDWEIEYYLKRITRQDRTSQTNGVVGVVMKVNGGYDWLRQVHKNPDGCTSIETKNSYLYDIIKNNRFNQKPKEYDCDICQIVDSLKGSYISLINEEYFLNNSQKYIENAYNKSENDASGYMI